LKSQTTHISLSRPRFDRMIRLFDSRGYPLLG
jgi:hypothetical protein